MKKILTSLVVVSALVAAVAIGTQALFSDTETSTGNTFTTGTIDIAVDGENPWTSSYEWKLEDMKPSYTGYLDFEVENVGTNPLNLWKTLTNFDTYDIELTEPEELVDPDGSIHNIDAWINYDMRVELYMPGGEEPVWWETIYMDEDGFTLADLSGASAEDKAMYLGMIPVGWKMKVIQSYHMVTEAGNQYQGDGMSFDIELYAEQLTNTVRLVKKYEADTDVSHHVWLPETYADFSYKVKDDELRWSLDTTDVADGNYTLLVWDDSDTSFDGTAYNWEWNVERSEAVVLAHLTDTGDMTHAGAYNPDADIVNAKVWLVPGTHGTVEGSAGAFPWNATGTYFETGLVDYYDSLN